MRTKTALLCAASLAAGVVGSMAQSNVYSINIVGYVNTTIGGGNVFAANPLNLDNTNSAANVLNVAPLNDNNTTPPGNLNSFFIDTWNGSSWKSVCYYEADFDVNNVGGATNGWATDGSGSANALPTAAGSPNQPGFIPNLAPGFPILIVNQGPAATNTFVGSVSPLSGATNNTAIGGGNVFVSSTLPVSGSLSNAAFQLPVAPLNDNNTTPAGDINSFFVDTWNGSSWKISVYYEADFDVNNVGGATGGWATDGSGSANGVPPAIGLGQVFLLVNQGPAATWAQTNIVP